MTTSPLVLQILNTIESDLRSLVQQVEKDGDLYTDEELLSFWRKVDGLRAVVDGGTRAMDRARKRNWISRVSG